MFKEDTMCRCAAPGYVKKLEAALSMAHSEIAELTAKLKHDRERRGVQTTCNLCGMPWSGAHICSSTITDTPPEPASPEREELP
jgi:hypothetical protein